jgi:hypothetical protein
MAGIWLLAVGLGAGFPATPSTERHVVPGGAVAIYDLAGRVAVEPTTGTDVVVEVSRGGADAARLRVELGPVGEWQTLRVIFPEARVVYPEPGSWGDRVQVTDDGRFDDGSVIHRSAPRHTVLVTGRGPGLEAHADLRVLVPGGRTLALFLAAGAATVSNVDGDLRVSVASATVTTRQTRGSLVVESGSGELRVNDAEGRISLDAGSGGALVRGARRGPLRLDTGSGGVTVIDAEVDELEAETGSGAVEITDSRSPEIALDTGSGSVRVNLLRGPLRTLDVDCGSGGVTLAVPKQLDATFDVESGSGGVRIEVPHQLLERDGDHLRGRFGDGRGHIRIEAGSGSVRIVPRESFSSQWHGGPGTLLGNGLA